MSFSEKIRVGVLRGGPSPEYEISLKTGSTIIANLPEEYKPIDVFISKDGVWHMNGLEKSPYQILKTVDIVFNALHGSFGEDGKLQKMLDDFKVPYTGSKHLSSAFGMNKVLSKKIFRNYGLKTPVYAVVEKEEDEKISDNLVTKINENIPFPIIIKPAYSGSSLGVSFVPKKENIKEALEEAFKYSSKVLVEEYISGKEVTCGVIDGFRGQNFYTLLPVEIVNENKKLHDFNSKYADLETIQKIPGSFTEQESDEIKETAKMIHKSLGLEDYSRSDFILHPKRGLFVLEVNTLPELSHRSSFIKSLEALGGNIKEFLSHILHRNLKK